MRLFIAAPQYTCKPDPDQSDLWLVLENNQIIAIGLNETAAKAIVHALTTQRTIAILFRAHQPPAQSYLN